MTNSMCTSAEDLGTWPRTSLPHSSHGCVNMNRLQPGRRRSVISWSPTCAHDVCGSPSTLISPFSSSFRTSSTSLRFVANLCTPPERVRTLLTRPAPSQPNAYDLKETYVESYTESLTHPQFSKQGFLEDVEYDDTALEDTLREAHREHVYHSQREDLSVGQSSSSMSERTGRPVGERTGRLVGPIGQELNVANAQIRTLLERQKEQILAECQAEIKKHEFQADYERRSVRKLSAIIESQQEQLHCAQAEELQRPDQQLLHERTVIAAKFGIT